MAGLASLTLRCLREDLALAVPRADTSLEEISHPLLAKATERFADDQTPHEGIAAIDDEVLFKVKAQRRRGAIWVDAGIPWLVAAGLREEGSPDDFYASLAARGKAARRATTPSTPRRWLARPTPPTCCPGRDDDLRWRRDGGVLAQPGGDPAQDAQAAAVAQLGVQPFGAADPFRPTASSSQSWCGPSRAGRVRRAPPVSSSAVAAVA